MEKILYIVPGFGESYTDTAYIKLRKIAQKKGYVVIFAKISWSYKTISSWLGEFENTINDLNPRDITVLGFSFGAMISILSSKNKNFKRLILCSPSPYFKEDLNYLPKSAKKWIGKRRLKDFAKYSFPENISMPAVFIMGNNDWEFGLKCLKERYKLWKGKKSIKILEGVSHDIGEHLYQQEIEKLL